MVTSQTVDSKPVKQEVNGTVILPTLVFTDLTMPFPTIEACDKYLNQLLIFTSMKPTLTKVASPKSACDSLYFNYTTWSLQPSHLV